MDYQGGGGFGGGSSASPPMQMRPGGGGTGISPMSAGRSGSQSRASNDEKSLQPVTIGMIHSSQTDQSDETLHLADGRRIYHVKIVAAVRTFENMSTNCIYTVEDGTGLIEVKQWQDNTIDCQGIQDLRAACAREHIYLACTGQVKDYDGKKTIVADSVRPIANGNELTYHMLEVVYTAEQYKRQNQFGSQLPPMQGVGFGGIPNTGARIPQQSNMGDGGDGVKDAILSYVRTNGEHTEIGVSVQSCIGAMHARFSDADVRKAFDDLAAEGHIYSTIDENNYKSA